MALPFDQLRASTPHANDRNTTPQSEHCFLLRWRNLLDVRRLCPPVTPCAIIPQVIWPASLRSEAQVHVCLPVHGAPWWVLLQHYIMLRLFFIVECRIVPFLCAMRVLEVWASSSSPLGYLCAKFSFFRNLHCWPSPWRKIIAYSNHSTSLFDAPGSEVCASE